MIAHNPRFRFFRWLGHASLRMASKASVVRIRPSGAMNYSHDLWQDFLSVLSYHVNIWGCDGHTQQHAITIAKNMGADIPASIEFWNEHGGYCDCEILMNVQQDWDAEFEPAVLN